MLALGAVLALREDIGNIMWCRARVAEWQTRTVQVRVPERAWGFNSPLAHQMKEWRDPTLRIKPTLVHLTTFGER